ncbi:MAG: hypothetical protein ACR2PG_08615 [Hyphomicrobiaceae bacterium]
MTKCSIPFDTEIGRQLRDAAADCRILLISGLPSTGKSLMLQQLIILANEAGRPVHTMQWDDARSAFETQEWLYVFPEINSVTHPGIRKAVGLWVRGAVWNWYNVHGTRNNLLIVELPVIGGRFVELLQPQDDAPETILTSKHTLALVPVPTNEMRRAIAGIRADTSSYPRNKLEARDAPPHIVESQWAEAHQLYAHWNTFEDSSQNDVRYQEAMCRSMFEHLCRYRHVQVLTIDRVFPTTGSVYERIAPTKPLRATSNEVIAAFAKLKCLYPGQSAERATEDWSDY